MIKERLPYIISGIAVLFGLAHILIVLQNQDMCTWNYGMSFGVGASINNNYTTLLTFTVIFLLFVYRERFEDRLIRALLLAAAIGGAFNFFDRMIYGGVCDYINFEGGLVFNLNDVIIVSSLFMLFIYVLYKSRFK